MDHLARIAHLTSLKAVMRFNIDYPSSYSSDKGPRWYVYIELQNMREETKIELSKYYPSSMNFDECMEEAYNAVMKVARNGMNLMELAPPVDVAVVDGEF